MNETYYVKTEEKEHTVKIQNETEKFYSYDGELVENPTGTLVEKTITENGEYLPSDDDADGYSKVTVNVQPTGGSKLEQIISRTVTELTANDYDGATIIGSSAFSNCKQLRTAIIPNSVKSIGNSAFYNCKRLTGVTISDGIEKIESYSFSSCSVLSSITIYATIPPVLSDVNGIPSNSIIYVPAASVDAYKTATNWSVHASRIQAIPA